MRIINDSDTTTFTDHSGDSITLLDCPRQKDVEKSREMEQDDAFGQLDNLKKIMGEDVIADIQAKATADPEAAKAQAGEGELSLDVRRFRLIAVAKNLCVGGQTYGGQAVVEQYDKMDADSVAWVDAQVATVWAKGTPSDVARESGGASVGSADLASATSQPAVQGA